MANENNNLFGLGFNNTNNFFNTQKYYGNRFQSPFNYNQSKTNEQPQTISVFIENIEVLDVPKMQCNPNEYFIKTREFEDVIPKYFSQLDEKEKIEYYYIKAQKDKPNTTYSDITRLFNDIKKQVQWNRNAERANLPKTDYYLQKWEDEDIVETFKKLVKSPFYKDIKDGKGYDPNKKTSDRYKIH